MTAQWGTVPTTPWVPGQGQPDPHHQDHEYGAYTTWQQTHPAAPANYNPYGSSPHDVPAPTGQWPPPQRAEWLRAPNSAPQPPPAPRKRGPARWVAAIAVLLIMVCGGGALFLYSIGSQPAPNPDRPDPVIATSQAPAGTNPTPTPTAAAKAPTTAAAEPQPAQFGDGQWQVPSQVKPGKYRTTVPDTSVGCYWQRLRGFSGEFDDIIANGLGHPGQQVVVTIAKTDAGFDSQRCGTWVKIG